MNISYHQICSKENGCTWEESIEVCAREGGYLVRISSKEENDKILEIINDMGTAAQRHHFRLGANDIVKDGDFRWKCDNSAVGYRNFNPGKS